MRPTNRQPGPPQRNTLVQQSIAINPKIQSGMPQAYRDWIGVGASLLCAVHCAAMPFVVGFLPLLGLSFLADPSFHQWMVGACLALALLAFVPGWRRHHRLAPSIIGLTGLGLISFAAFAGPDDCCPTPCAASTSPEDPMVMTTAMSGDSACALACCSSEATSETGAPAITPDTAPSSDAAACAAECCSSTGDVIVVAAGPCTAPSCDDTACDSSCCVDSESGSSVTTDEVLIAALPGDEGPCSEECCPIDGNTVSTADSSGFMYMFWLLMTPLGGLILVTAHLTNHRLGCRCTSKSCPHSKSAPAIG